MALLILVGAASTVLLVTLAVTLPVAAVVGWLD